MILVVLKRQERKQLTECYAKKLQWSLISADPWLTATTLAQSVEGFTAEREVVGSIPGVGPILRVLKLLTNEGTSFAMQAAWPSRGSDDHVKCKKK